MFEYKIPVPNLKHFQEKGIHQDLDHNGRTLAHPEDPIRSNLELQSHGKPMGTHTTPNKFLDITNL